MKIYSEWTIIGNIWLVGGLVQGRESTQAIMLTLGVLTLIFSMVLRINDR